MSWLDFFTGEDSDADQAKILESEERLRQENAVDAERIRQQLGDRAAEQFLAEREDNLRRGDVGDVNAEIQAAFNEGFDEGAQNIQNVVGGTVGTVIGTPFKILPWWMILGAAAFAFFWFFGAPKFLKPS